MSSFIDITRADKEFPRVKCEVASVLGDPDAWELLPALFAESLVRMINGYDQAQLAWYFGAEMKPQEATHYASVEPLALLGKFIKITVTPPEDPFTIIFDWVGVVTTEAADRGSAKVVEAAFKFVAGKQEFGVVGLEYYLDRRQITSSIVDGTRIERALTFNGGFAERDTHIDSRKNRHSVLGGDGVYEFAHSPSSVAFWSAKQILDYLFKFHAPSFPCPLVLDAAAGDYLDALVPTVPTNRQTVFKILNDVCTPTRGLCWWLEYDIDANTATIRVQSSAVNEIELPGGATLAANSEQVWFNFDLQEDITGPRISRNRSNRYDQIICRGNRMTSVFSVGFGDTTLQKDWIDANEDDYKAAAKDKPDAPTYAALSDTDQKKSNDAFRRDHKFDRVYTNFRMPANWDGQTADGSGLTGKEYAFPTFDAAGDPNGHHNVAIVGLRMLSNTTLKSGATYVSKDDLQNITPLDSGPEYLRPFAIIKIGDATGDAPRYQYCDRLSVIRSTDSVSINEKIKTSYRMYIQQHTPGFRLEAGNGLNHMLAENHWTDAEPTTHEPEADYEEVIATLCAEGDVFCEGRYPETDPTEPAEVLVLQFSEEYRLDYVAPSTVVSLVNGVQQLSEGFLIRDDRKDLADIARFAWQWYETERRTCVWTVKQIAAWSHPVSGNPVGVGSLITNLGVAATETVINTLIAKVSYNFAGGITEFTTTGDQLNPSSFTLR